MRFEADAVIPKPCAMVFRAYRDHLPQLVEGLPRIKRIEVERRTDEGAQTELVNIWYAASKIPAVAEKILPDVLSWHDYARWDESRWRCDWRVESHVFTEAVQCSGHTTFVDLGARTRVEIEGDIRIDLSKVRVPELLANPISNSVERFFVRLFTPNLLSISDALEDYLSGDAGSGGMTPVPTGAL